MKSILIVGEQRRWSSLTAFVSAIGIALYILAPTTAATLVPVAGLGVIAWHSVRELRPPMPTPSTPTVILGLGGIYLTINSTWSLAGSAAYTSVAFYFAMVVVIFVVVTSIQQSTSKFLRPIAFGIAIAMSFSAVFVLCELLGGQPLRLLLISHLPIFLPTDHQFPADVTFLRPDLLNKSAAALSICLWPAMLVVSRVDARRWQRIALYAGLGGAVLAIFGSAHETSQLACLGGAVMFATFTVSPAVAWRLSVAGWTAATLLVVPLCALAYHHEFYLVRSLPESARARIVIWGYTSDQIARAPALGVGVRTTQVLNKQGRPEAERAPGTNFKRMTARHSHNIYLQVWFETGAAGAAILFVLGLSVLRSLTTAPSDAQPYLYATFATCALIGASSYSLWARWFMASFALASMLASIGIALRAKLDPSTSRYAG